MCKGRSLTFVLFKTRIKIHVMLIFVGKRNSSWSKSSERECHMRMNSMQSVRSFCNNWNWSSLVSMQSLEQEQENIAFPDEAFKNQDEKVPEKEREFGKTTTLIPKIDSLKCVSSAVCRYADVIKPGAHTGFSNRRWRRVWNTVHYFDRDCYCTPTRNGMLLQPQKSCVSSYKFTGRIVEQGRASTEAVNFLGILRIVLAASLSASQTDRELRDKRGPGRAGTGGSPWLRTAPSESSRLRRFGIWAAKTSRADCSIETAPYSLVQNMVICHLDLEKTRVCGRAWSPSKESRKEGDTNNMKVWNRISACEYNFITKASSASITYKYLSDSGRLSGKQSPSEEMLHPCKRGDKDTNISTVNFTFNKNVKIIHRVLWLFGLTGFKVMDLSFKHLQEPGVHMMKLLQRLKIQECCSPPQLFPVGLTLLLVCCSCAPLVCQSTHGSGVYMGLEEWRMYCVEWNTRNASPARKSREESKPATGRSRNP
ncbi:hypothetical protein IHE44_0012354, partial [Lamprotornis superbus]